MGDGPVPSSYNKKGHVLYLCVCEMLYKYWNCIGLQPVLFLSANWMLVGILRQVGDIVIIIATTLHFFYLHCVRVMASVGE